MSRRVHTFDWYCPNYHEKNYPLILTHGRKGKGKGVNGVFNITQPIGSRFANRAFDIIG